MDKTFQFGNHLVQIVAVKSRFGIGNFKYYTAEVYQDGNLVLATDILENDPETAIHNAELEFYNYASDAYTS